MKHVQHYVLGLVALVALAGCSSHHHQGMMSGGTGDGYWQKGSRTWLR